jgi:hypothetical protein
LGLDKDRFSFELRKSPDDIQSSRKFSFDEDLADKVNEVTYYDQLVEVVGIQPAPQKPVRARIIHHVGDPNAIESPESNDTI